MARAPRTSLPREWRRFADRYGADRAYWYTPKGLAVTPESLRSRLRVLREFEGSARPWRDVQADYIRRLNEEGISLAAAEWAEGGAPLARMLKKVFGTLGLAWVDLDERVEITPAGERFLSSDDPAGVLSDQMSRFQFWNPSVMSRVHREIKLHPVPFLGELLRNLENQRVSSAEYTLFVSRAKAFDDVDQVLERIEAFRGLSEDAQAAGRRGV
jgi:hypothetical protein